MVMAHDAATSYLKGGFFHQINDWAKTQGDGGFTAMLNCGARAFDVRPKMTSDGIHFHHGKIDISKNLEEVVVEVLQFSTEHNSTEVDNPVKHPNPKPKILTLNLKTWKLKKPKKLIMTTRT